MCCRRALCASATSASSPTATALLSFPYAVACSAAQRKRQFRQLNRLRKRFTHSGTVHSAVQPCTSLSGSPPHNSCFAHHLNQNGPRHEALSISSGFARASARMQNPCLIRPRMLAHQLLQLPMVASLRSLAILSCPRAGRTYLSPHLRGTSVPDQTYSKCIAQHRGGFLQVAVSEAPRSEHAATHCCASGAPDTALGPVGTWIVRTDCLRRIRP